MISLTKDPATQQILSGQDANFTITVTNTGNSPLTNVTVTDALGVNYSAYTRTVTVTQQPAGPGCPLHPVTGVSATCKEVVVTVAQGPDALAEVTFLLVDY